MLEAFLARGDESVAVFCAPEKEGARPDALRLAAQQRGLNVHQFKSLRDPEATRAMQEAGADLGIMAFVTQFAPAGIRHDTQTWHDPVSSLAVAEVSRPQFHQLADHQGRYGDRFDHLPSLATGWTKAR